MGDALLLFNISRPQRLTELSNVTQMASRTLAGNSPCFAGCWRRLRENSTSPPPVLKTPQAPCCGALPAQTLQHCGWASPVTVALANGRAEISIRERDQAN